MATALEPSRFLAVTDLGPGGAAAVRVAAARAREVGGALAVVHAIPSLAMVRPVFPERIADDALRQAILPQRVRQALGDQLATQVSDGPRPDVFLEYGGAATTALLIADRWHADLIVIGAAEDDAGVDVIRVVRHAQVPTLIVRDGPERGPIVACTDFSDPALPVVRRAAEESRRTGATLHVLHALPPLPAAIMGVEGHGVIAGAEWHAERRRDAEGRLRDVMAEVDAHGQGVVVEGPVVPALAGTARELGASLTVIGTVGRTGLTRFLLGSVAEALMRASPCSVLVVRLDRARVEGG